MLRREAVVETGAWSEPSTSSTGAFAADPGEQRAVMVACSSVRLALQLGAEPHRRAADHLSDRAAGVDGVERAVGSHRGGADLLEVGADPAGLEVERDHIALAVEGEDQALLGSAPTMRSTGGSLSSAASRSADRGTGTR